MKKHILGFLGVVAILFASLLGGMFGKEFGRELVKPPKLTPKEVEQKLIIYLRESTNYLRVATGFAAGLGTEKPGVATPII